MTEIWKDIKGYEGYYMASSNGLIKSISRIILDKRGNHKKLQGKLLKGALSDSGYLKVSLCKDGVIKCINIQSIILPTFKEKMKVVSLAHSAVTKASVDFYFGDD